MIMKKLLFNTLALFLLLAFATVPVEAQKRVDLKAVVDAFDSTVVKYNGQEDYLEQLADMLCKQHDNNAEVLTGIANAFFRHNAFNTEKYHLLGEKYIDMALAKRKQYVPAYIVKGNTYMSEHFPDSIQRHGYGLVNDIDSALYWFQRGIDANPQEVLGYEEYALAQAFYMRLASYPGERSEAPVVVKLQEYAKFKPDYPVYLKAAQILGTIGWQTFAFNCYEKVDVSTMNADQLREYIELCGTEYARRASVAEAGVTLFPDSAFFYYEAFKSNSRYAIELQKLNRSGQADSTMVSSVYDKAVAYWQKFQTFGTRVQPGILDFCYAGWSYEGKADFGKDDKYALYGEAINTLKEGADNESFEPADRYLAYKSMATVYRKMRQWEKATSAYDEAVQIQKGSSQLAECYMDYADLCARIFNTIIIVNTDSAYAYLVKADSLLEYVMKNVPYEKSKEDIHKYRIEYTGVLLGRYYNKEFARSEVLFETEYGKRYAENMLAFEEQLPDEMIMHLQDVALAYRYLANYCWIKGSFRQAKQYFQKLLEYIPNDEDALAALKELKRY